MEMGLINPAKRGVPNLMRSKEKRPFESWLQRPVATQLRTGRATARGPQRAETRKETALLRTA